MKKILSVLLSMFFVMGALAGCTPNAGLGSESGNSDSTSQSGSSNVGAPDDVEKNYTITFDAKGGSIEQTTMTVTYGETYTLPVPEHQDRDFQGWMYNNQKVEVNGVWEIEAEGTEIVLVAKWGSSNWTNNY